MKTKALDLRVLIAAAMLLAGGLLFSWKPLAFAGKTIFATDVVNVVQDKAGLSEVELMLLIHRPELPRATGAGTAR